MTDSFFTEISEGFTDSVTKERLQDLLQVHKINPEDPPPEPPYCMWIDDKPVAVYGGIAVVSGKAKSRKSTWLSLIVSAYLKNDSGYIKTNVAPGKEKVIYIDTEQGAWRTFKAHERITQLSGDQIPNQLDVYDIRTLDYKVRLQFIEYAVYNTDNVGILIIDGIRDVVSSINDEEQATEVVHRLLKWSGELGIHIIVVLHENKGNDLLRGHLGTELMNKSEIVYSVTKDQYSPEQSIIEYKASRDLEPPKTAIAYGVNGLPEIITDWISTNETKPGKPRPTDFDTGKHFEILRKVFRRHREFTRNEIIDQLKLVWGENGNKFGNTIAREYLTFYFDHNYIKKTGATNRTKYILGDLNPGDVSEIVAETDVPF